MKLPLEVPTYRSTDLDVNIARTMFWMSRPKPSVTDTDQAWLLEAVPELLRVFGPERLLRLPTYTPNTKYFPHDFTGNERDAEFVLAHVCRSMDTPSSGIDLMFFDDGSRVLDDGLQFTTADLKGQSHGAAGTYSENPAGRYNITIDTKTLRNAQNLIATVAHEVAHIKLLGEGRLDHEDPHHELWTDLAVIVHGYGIFQGNSAFSFNQWQGNSHHGWSTRRIGYLPLEVIGFALALLTVMKKEDPDWIRYLASSFLPHFRKNHEYIRANMEIADQAFRNMTSEPPEPEFDEDRPPL